MGLKRAGINHSRCQGTNTAQCWSDQNGHPCRVGSEGTWRWDALGSGVLEPVVAGRICRQNSKGSAVDLLPSLHRAHE